MSQADCRDALVMRKNGIRTPAAEGTLLFSSASIFREMADAYLADGDRFRSMGDLMNAYASYWYALGWLDAGTTLGLIITPVPGSAPDFSRSTQPDPDTVCVREKTTRYRSLLGRALESLKNAPENDASLFAAAEQFMATAISAYQRGISLDQEQAPASALAAYSYGFAWLDAGVRFGLFRIIDHRELFTI
jgi:hypothetical protein